MTNTTGTEFLPTEFTLGRGTDDERTYELFSFIEGQGFPIDGQEMVKRAEKLDANLGREHRQYILDHQDEIPPELKEKVHFIFTAERYPTRLEHVSYIFCNGGRWLCAWGYLNEPCWGSSGRLLRQRQPASAT